MKRKIDRVIGIVAIKGGVGKTTTVSNLGVLLASEYNIHCLVVDANISVPNLGLHLNIVDPQTTLQDILSDGNRSLTEAVYVHDSGLHVIPGSMSITNVNLTLMEEAVKSLANKYEIVLMDSSPGIGEEIKAVMDVSTELLIVSSLDFPTISSALKIIKLADSMDKDVLGVVLNKVKKTKHELDIKDVESVLNIPVLAVIPEDPKVPEALSFNMPVVLYAPNSPASRVYTELAGKISGAGYWPNPLKIFLDRILGFFQRRF